MFYRLDVLKPEAVGSIYRRDHRPLSAEAPAGAPARKLGLQVTDYLRYASVRSLVLGDERAEGFSEHMLKWFRCPICGREMMINRADLLRHLDDCQQARAHAAAADARPGKGPSPACSADRCASGPRPCGAAS
jgi:hypothetical protein